MHNLRISIGLFMALVGGCGGPGGGDGSTADSGRTDAVTADNAAVDSCTNCGDGTHLDDAIAADTSCASGDCDGGLDTGVDVVVTDGGIDTPSPRDTGVDVPAPRDTGVEAAADAGGTRGVTVVGARLHRDGVAFQPHGFNMIGVLTPDACTAGPGSGRAARASFTMAELLSARDTFHANTVRLQISQPGLDPMDPMHSAAYVTRITNGVALARSLGFVVIVSMQDQSIGCGGAIELPTAATVRAWTAAAPLFRDDPYVMFELYNEPQNDTSAAGWAQWRDGGNSPIALGEPAIGHQALVNLLRNTLRTTNVLVADGANHAGQLQGVPHLVDTLAVPQIAYAVHPYYFHINNTASLAQDTANWDTRFGYLTATLPVLATEWNASASCFTGQAARIPDFFAYLTAHNIGLFGHAFDVPQTMVNNLTTWPPTMFTDCTTAGSDAGELVQSYYATLAR